MNTKLSYSILLILLVQSLFSQNELPIDLLTVDHQFSTQNQSRSAVARTIFYKLNTDQLNTRRNLSDQILLNIPLFEKSVSLSLKKVNLLSDNFSVKTAKGELFTDGTEYDFYQGFIVGKEANSIAAVTIRNGELSLLMTDENGNFQINRHDKEHLIGYYNNELKEQAFFECHTREEAEDVERNSGSRNAPSNACVDIYFEVDFAAYKKKGSSLSSTTDWVVGLFNQVALQFNRVSVPLKISEIMIHTETDPYAGISGSTNVLYEFRNIRNQTGFNGRLAHLLSTRSLGGGVAWLNSLCSNYSNYAVSGNLNGGVVAYPNYSWNTMVIAHETGHNFGSNHTQACVWNGNNTAIDGCVNSEGSCPRPPAPAGGGTIMSYCHLNGVGMNPLKGFGPQPGAKIYGNFQNASCTLSQDCSDVPPVNDICVTAIELTPTQSCITWPYHNINSGSSNGLSAFDCGDSNDVKDVWFSVVVPSTGQVVIETSTINSGLSDLIMELYTGDCFNLTLADCDDNSGDGSHAKITIDDIDLADNMVFIRVGDKGSNDEGDFSICAYSPSLPCSENVGKLVDFYNSLGGANWTNKSGWEDGAAGQDCDICQWYGLTCNNKGEIVTIDLSNNNLTGTLSNDIDTFSNLVNLDLSQNNITGSLPIDIGNLSLLKSLRLDNNNLDQQMPDELRSLRVLTHLDLSNNQFSGTTPLYLGYNAALDYIDFSNNQLSGCIDRSLYNKCTISFLSLLGNSSLAYGGDLTTFCVDYSGSDGDGDGHCKNVDDCNDNNADSFDGNPEICDGIDNDCDGEVDNGFDNLVNEFLDLSEDWEAVSNWSLGHAPLACEEVWIGMNDENCTISTPENTYGITLKGLKIGQGSAFTVPESSGIQLTSKGILENYGTMIINGNIYSQKTDNSIAYGLRNFGEIQINEGSMGFGQQNGDIIINESTGVIINKGYLSMYIHSENPVVNNGIINYGTITNYNSIQVYGVFTGNHLVLKPNSTFTSFIGGQWDEISLGN
jgi:hypothetical protein